MNPSANCMRKLNFLPVSCVFLTPAIYLAFWIFIYRIMQKAEIGVKKNLVVF